MFLTAERCPGVPESLAEGMTGVFSRRWRSSTGQTPAFSSLQSSSTAPCFDEHSASGHFTKFKMRAVGAMGQLMMAGSASWWNASGWGDGAAYDGWKRELVGACFVLDRLPFRASSPRRLLHHVPLYRVCRGISPSWKCGHLGAMGQLMMAGSASWWALALFWTAERSPGVSESLVKDALAVFSRRWRSSTGRAPELLMAGSASWWALALFWTAERCPGVSESWAKGAVS